jgi:hypothetical protein
MKIKHIDDDTLIYQTNCLYRDHGQIIICRKVGQNENGTINTQCNDISRGIYFLVNEVNWNARAIQNRYLNNTYSLDINYMLDRELGQIAQDHIEDMWHTRQAPL